MGFFKTLKSSVYNPKFYSAFREKTLGSALKYFFLLGLVLTGINVLLLSYDLVIKVPEEIKIFVTQAVNSFPDKLEVDIDKGQVATNVPEPFFISFPKSGD